MDAGIRIYKAVSELTRLADSLGFRVVLDAESWARGGGYLDLQARAIHVSCPAGFAQHPTLPLREGGEARPRHAALTADHDIVAMVFILAHETRHAQHVATGLFASYYDPAYDKVGSRGGPDPLCEDELGCIPHPLVGLAAERDCDRWAEAFVRRTVCPGFRLRTLYPMHDVAGYNDHKGRSWDARHPDVIAIYRELRSLLQNLSPGDERGGSMLARQLTRLSAVCPPESLVGRRAKRDAAATRLRVALRRTVDHDGSCEAS